MHIATLPVGALAVNCHFIHAGDGGVVVIDPGDEAARIDERLSGQRLLAVLLTHGHFDHTGAVRGLMERHPGVPVYIHEDDVPMCANAVSSGAALFGLRGWMPFEPAHTLRGGETLVFSDIRLEVLHTPGHTPGSLCYYAGVSGTLFSGDTLFKAGVGRTDLPGGDGAALLDSLTRLFTLPDGTRVLPGHGAATTIGVEKQRYTPSPF